MGLEAEEEDGSWGESSGEVGVEGSERSIETLSVVVVVDVDAECELESGLVLASESGVPLRCCCAFFGACRLK